MAANVMSMLPVLLLFFLAQRYFIRGIATSGLKGCAWPTSHSSTSARSSPAARSRSTTCRWTSPDGEFLILVGPSGCGKTTALRLIAGLEKPTAGTIRIGAETVNGSRRGTGTSRWCSRTTRCTRT